LTLLIQFSEVDLAKITIAGSPDPLWEALLGLHALQSTEVDPVIATWRARVDLTAATRGLFRIAPARGYSPDFLTPEESTEGLDAGLEAIQGATSSRLRGELARLAGGREIPQWARDLAAGGRGVLGELAAALKAFHRTALAPHWAAITECVDDDRRARARTLLDSGLAGLLSGLHPLLTWRGSTLELHGPHVSGELVLGGRGLRLVPSFFCHMAPTVLADPALPPVLVYPIAIDPARFHAGSPASWDPAAALASLLGKTRAQLLVATARGCTTTELGRHAGISTASASYHASILREAGLIETRREGTAVRHTLTELGANLMNRRLLGVA
jgi:DNA-binding transcriptional ArsR family regulator